LIGGQPAGPIHLPLADAIARKADARLDVVIVGGIVTGTVFTLLVLPVALRLFGDFFERNGKQDGDDPDRADPGPSAAQSTHPV